MGEDSTHASTYTGVRPLAWAAAPRVFEKDKKDIIGHDVQAPPPKFFDGSVGQPLFWNERRSAEFWQHVLGNFNVKVVVDLSPGSGQLARACLDTATSCIAVARNQSHSSWLQNVLDRYVMLTIVRSGTYLHDSDLAASIKELFFDVLDQLHAADASDDNDPDEAA